MTLSELAALRLAICKAVIQTYPRGVLYEFIKRNAPLSERPYSDGTVRAVRKVLDKSRRLRRKMLFDLVSHDLNETMEALKSIETTYEPERTLPAMRDDVIAFLEEELGCKAPVRLSLSVVEKYPHPYEHFNVTAWSLSEYESKIIGIPMGVYLKRDELFPVLAEWVVAHELAHSVIVDLPNYVTWFDEGLADFLGYIYYVRKIGKIENLSIWTNYRSEFESYGRWYAEYDKLISNLFVCAGLNFVKALVRLKQTDPNKVDWLGLVRALQSNPSLEALESCVNAQVSGDRLLPSDYASVAALMTTPTLAYTISPEAYIVFRNILSAGRKADAQHAFQGVPRPRQKSAREELMGHMLIYRDGKELAIFGGSMVGSETLFDSSLVRAHVSIAELNKAYRN